MPEVTITVSDSSPAEFGRSLNSKQNRLRELNPNLLSMKIIALDWDSPEEVAALLEKVHNRWSVFNPNRKIVTVNWGSYDEVTQLGKSVKSRIAQLKTEEGVKSNRQHNRDILDACESIINTNTSSVYSGLPLNESREYYVYAHLDTSHKIAIGKHGITSFAATLGMDYFPFYIGKGTGDRCFDITRNETHRKVSQKLKRLHKEIKVIKLRENLTESEALQFEAKLIDIFGLIPYKGFLTNLDEGHNPVARRALYPEAFLQLRKINSVFSDKSSF